MNRHFNFLNTGFYAIWSTITQWRWTKIALFAAFILWAKDGSIDHRPWQHLAIALSSTLALASLLDTILLILPPKVRARLNRTREEHEAWERLGAFEAKP